MLASLSALWQPQSVALFTIALVSVNCRQQGCSILRHPRPPRLPLAGMPVTAGIETRIELIVPSYYSTRPLASLFFFFCCHSRTPAAEGHLVARQHRANRHQPHLRGGGRHRDGESAADWNHHARLLRGTHRVPGRGHTVGGAGPQGCHRAGSL